MVKSAVIVLALIGAALAAPPAPAPERIVGGSATTIQKYPYIATFQKLTGITWRSSCGGSLLTSRTILTAAHCFYGEIQPGTVRARLGSSFKSSGGQVIYASHFILHEDYSFETLENDIAIVTLAAPAVLSNTVKIVRIPPPDYIIPDNQMVTAIGWGDFEFGGPGPEQLQHVDLYTVNQQVCADRFVFLQSMIDWPMQVNDGMICIGILDIGGQGQCQGDSGGPVSLKTAEGDLVIGVTSWTYGCARWYYPVVNARTTYYYDWIVKHGSVPVPLDV